ncbi:MAG: YwbE family protein [Candidatus Staskawiczbacteria bacterium]|nr:YwbE family protein [Candidatus Staskawiczbacteria bacterium]
MTSSGQVRKDIIIGGEVDIVLKADQKTGKLTNGRVKDILTSSSSHHRGIKVWLEDGQIGRVQVICPKFPTLNGVEYQEGLT